MVIAFQSRESILGAETTNVHAFKIAGTKLGIPNVTGLGLSEAPILAGPG